MKCSCCGAEMKMDFGNMCDGSDSSKLVGGMVGIVAGFLLGGPPGMAAGLAIGSRAGKKLSTMYYRCPQCGHTKR